METGIKNFKDTFMGYLMDQPSWSEIHLNSSEVGTRIEKMFESICLGMRDIMLFRV
jgi:hypothetical protein